MDVEAVRYVLPLQRSRFFGSKKGSNGTMFFIILGNEELWPVWLVLFGTTNGPSGTRAALEIPAAAYPTTRYRAPLPDAAHAIAAEAI